jgi:O-acetyl-ADP-ribose deacetylase (regulator of RNase III)
MVVYKQGNLLEDEAEILVNTVNTVGVMGKGIALAFKNAFPFNYQVYQQKCRAGELTIGVILPVTDSNLLYGTKVIVNFPTKTHWRKPSEYAYIENGLQALRDWLVNENIKSIAIPPLGCGNGGLDWAKVKPMILSALNDLDCLVTIYGID